jgi:hypothetical protein
MRAMVTTLNGSACYKGGGLHLGELILFRRTTQPVVGLLVSGAPCINRFGRIGCWRLCLEFLVHEEWLC